jgi:hypothetical protein
MRKLMRREARLEKVKNSMSQERDIKEDEKQARLEKKVNKTQK